MSEIRARSPDARHGCDAGVDTAFVRARIAEAEGEAATTAHAVHRGVFGSPSFFVGEDLYFGKDRLRDAVEAAERT